MYTHVRHESREELFGEEETSKERRGMMTKESQGGCKHKQTTMIPKYGNVIMRTGGGPQFKYLAPK